MSEPVLSLLVVEDDDVAAEAIIRGIRKRGLDWHVVVVEDGVEALEVLRGHRPDRTLVKPFALVVDLNMPRMNGFELIETLRGDPGTAPHGRVRADDVEFAVGPAARLRAWRGRLHGEVRGGPAALQRGRPAPQLSGGRPLSGLTRRQTDVPPARGRRAARRAFDQAATTAMRRSPCEFAATGPEPAR